MRRKAHFVRRALTVLLAGALATGGVLSQNGVELAGLMPLATWSSVPPGVRAQAGRVLLTLDRPVSEWALADLSAHGTVHKVIPRLQVVAMTPGSAAARAELEQIPWVRRVEADQPRFLTQQLLSAAASWDRDVIDVHDVQESNFVGAPDPREVDQTGKGVHIAVLDTGLMKNWRDVLFESRVRADLARAFVGGGAAAEQGAASESAAANPPNLWERDTSSHGTAVASQIIGFKIGARVVDGVAPDAKIIPLKIFPNGQAFTWSSHIMAALDYVMELREGGEIGPLVVNMSFGGGAPSLTERAVIREAISRGVLLVGAAGNEGEAGMGWPAAFPEMISVGATGWIRQFVPVSDSGEPNTAFWWVRDVGNDPDGTALNESAESFVANFSSRAIPSRSEAFGVPAQQLDVLAPGNWIVAPGGHQGRSGFFFWSGTSFSAPLVSGVAALLLEKNANLNQAQVEAILKATALPMAAADARVGVIEINGVIVTYAWDASCAGRACDAAGAGLLQADAALAATP